MWSIDRVRRGRRTRHDTRSDTALALVRTVASRDEVVRCCPRCLRLGVRSGMTLAHARALVGSHPFEHAQHDPKADRDGLHRFAEWMNRLLPSVEPDPDEDATIPKPGLIADITGCQLLYKGEDNLLRAVLDAARGFGLRARVAAAPTYASAWALSRFGGQDIIRIEDDIKTHITSLPLRALRIEDKAIAVLREIGITTIGELLDVPRSTLPSRFGGSLTHRIDQLLGQAIDTIAPVRPEQPIVTSRMFDGPVKQLRAIEHTTSLLLDELCALLLKRERGMRLLAITLDRSDCEPYRIELALSHPNRTSSHIWKLLRPKIEKAHMGYGVEAITLAAHQTALLPHAQIGHSSLGENAAPHIQREAAQCADTLRNRLGDRAVRIPVLVPSHLPERTARFAVLASEKRSKPIEPDTRDRPTLLLQSPRPVDVVAVTPDGPIVMMTWNRTQHIVRASIGPERLSPEWWRTDQLTRATRDYFKVQDSDGCWWWLYRELDTPNWFVHGRWA